MQHKSPLEITDKIFCEDNDFDLGKYNLTFRHFARADDGELYLESTKSESFSFDDGRMKNIAYDSTKGFGLRAIAGEAGVLLIQEKQQSLLKELQKLLNQHQKIIQVLWHLTIT